MSKRIKSLMAVYSMLVVLFVLLFFVSVVRLHHFHDRYDSKHGGRCITAELGGNSTDLLSAACATKPRHHFDNIAVSYITVFQIMTVSAPRGASEPPAPLAPPPHHHHTVITR